MKAQVRLHLVVSIPYALAVPSKYWGPPIVTAAVRSVGSVLNSIRRHAKNPGAMINQQLAVRIVQKRAEGARCTSLLQYYEI
ncbi:hypothetical protein SeMB42_g07775 [Synchytrium endobioticum]|uniref:Secreted protein n=1 Tax=Synchytrium endobioticum TaxID=286115 RepID=A0A507BWS4_9FUNG|nr:hypothetical protein SeMB42_g07775 [Synchytrium endobioticum]